MRRCLRLPLPSQPRSWHESRNARSAARSFSALFVCKISDKGCTLVSISVLDICAYVGLVAVGAVAFNMVLGMLMAVRYSPVRSWPHRRFNYFQLHNWSGYVALAAAILHPLILLLNKPTRFRMVDVVYPVHSPSQPLENTVGAVALYTVAIVVVTSYLRVRLGRRLWKSVHFTIYFAAVAVFWHSLFTDPI
jgi:methionine sulfoxide reductase heme-binding subunit